MCDQRYMIAFCMGNTSWSERAQGGRSVTHGRGAEEETAPWCRARGWCGGDGDGDVARALRPSPHDVHSDAARAPVRELHGDICEAGDVQRESRGGGQRLGRDPWGRVSQGD